MDCLRLQTKLIGIFYLCFSIIDFLMMGLGNLLFTQDKDFVCVDDSMVMPNNNGGAGFLFAYSMMLLLYSLMLWFIFYKIPSRFGLISKHEHLEINPAD